MQSLLRGCSSTTQSILKVLEICPRPKPKQAATSSRITNVGAGLPRYWRGDLHDGEFVGDIVDKISEWRKGSSKVLGKFQFEEGTSTSERQVLFCAAVIGPASGMTPLYRTLAPGAVFPLVLFLFLFFSCSCCLVSCCPESLHLCYAAAMTGVCVYLELDRSDPWPMGLLSLYLVVFGW